jgi:transcriptional regulator with XRE-family HTH domain
MDDLRFGAAIRAARVRRGWRQVDLAIRAGVSDSLVSRIERGHLEGIQLSTLRAVAAALEVRVELLSRSRSADLDRLMNARHTALTEAMKGWLRTFPGWELRPGTRSPSMASAG